ncbi:MAG: inner membrane CreD family protein, partial [Spongiibacteraceae bacterium]|nr:inner membrane CreD family protein [Spongiibacteraceae bacterium]
CGEQLDEPFLSLSISDMRGIDQTPQWQINKTDRLVEPGSQLPGLSAGLHTRLLDMSELEQALTFSIHVSLRGMGQFSFISLADEASTRLKSNWPHPEFIGSSLPKHRDISSAGFTALWNSTQYSSNGAQLIARCLEQGNCVDLRNSSSGVKFIQAVDIYLQTDRSIKYAMLFIGLSFITFFIFEHSKKIRIHPIQYTFVGLAICVFYLLLISLAEHIAFHWAYTIAALCCSVLLLFYVRYMLKSFYLALFFFFMIMGLYALLFVIVQAEDFALLMGAFLVFLVLSVLMVVTRKIDWYTLVEKES